MFTPGLENYAYRTKRHDTLSPQSGDRIVARREGAVGIIEFDNPDGGFLTANMVSGMDRQTQAWEADASLRVVIFTGRKAGTFITHYSPAELQGMSAAVTECQTDAEVLALRRQAGAKPVEIFAIYRNGHAVATRGQ